MESEDFLLYNPAMIINYPLRVCAIFRAEPGASPQDVEPCLAQPAPVQSFVLWFLMEGEGRLQTGGKSYSLATGDCFFLPPLSTYSACFQRKKWRAVVVFFDCLDSAGRATIPPPPQMPPLQRRMPNAMLFWEVLMRVHLGLYGRNREYRDAANWMRGALEEMTMQDLEVIQRRQGILLEQESLLREMGSLIRLHPELPWPLEEIAGRLNCSARHAHRLFRLVHGAPLREYVIDARMERARSALRYSSKSVGGIAEQLGFCDIYYFSRLFRKREGCSPQAYRNRPLR